MDEAEIRGEGGGGRPGRLKEGKEANRHRRGRWQGNRSRYRGEREVETVVEKTEG